MKSYQRGRASVREERARCNHCFSLHASTSSMLLKVTLRKRLLLCEVQHGADKPEIIRYETGKVIQSKGWSLFCAKVQLLCKKGGVLVEQIVIYLGWLSGSSFRRWHSLECMFYPCFVKYPRLFPGVLNSPLTLSIENPTWDAFSSIVFNIAFEGTQIFRAVKAKKRCWSTTIAANPECRGRYWDSKIFLNAGIRKP